ncbi:MAG TPA: hypothetical protein VEL47_02755, partial [Myxococcota bacterium]|nr:hypothetical protein [Myxococcota bacterium]
PSDVEIKKSSLLYQMPLVFLALGIGCLTYWSVLSQENHPRAMFAYLFGFTVVLSLALGCMSFVLLQHLTRAGWSVAIRRLPETAIFLMPLFILFFIPIAVFAHDLFPWLHTEHIDSVLAKKLGYLNEPFFLWRSFGYLVVWAIMGVVFYRLSLAQDAGGKFRLTKLLQAMSAPCLVVFGLTLTFASLDWLMTLQPHWYSTMFGVYFYAGCVPFSLSFMTLMAITLQKAGLLTTAITGEHYHDLGKLLFGFTIFWAYIAFSQFMLYWYAAVPEEVEFYAHRLQNGWGIISWALPLINFFVPFFGLMSRTLKRVKLILTINCLWVIAAHLLDLYWLILPTYHDPNVPHGPPPVTLAAVDILATIGIFSIFFGIFLFVLSRHKILAVGDPRLSESLAFENV